MLILAVAATRFLSSWDSRRAGGWSNGINGWRLPPLRGEWCVWKRRQPPRGRWAVCCLGRAPGVSGRSPWDEVSVPLSYGPCVPASGCMLRGWEVLDEEGGAAGHMLSSCTFLSEGSCLPGTLGRGCMYIRVDPGLCIKEATCTSGCVRRLDVSARERECTRLSNLCQILTRLYPSEQQHGCGTARGECATHKCCLSPGSRPHPQGSGSLSFKKCPGDLLFCRSLRL